VSTTAARGLFVTGTDTGVGKTVVSVALLRALGDARLRAVGMKPVAAGIDEGERENADVAALAAASTIEAPRDAVNPYAFRPAIAPHVAALRAPSGSTFGTRNSEMPRDPSGASGNFARTKWTMLSVRSCSPPEQKIFSPVTR